jgi:2-polyprenyl-3-methyl-5-hydroxy-6-metoxy-1,4-benzoquinol methylase
MSIESFYASRQQRRDKSINLKAERRRYLRAIEQIEICHGMRILDAGCASGTLKDVLPPYVEYIGIDIIPRSPATICADVSKGIPLREDSIDVIFALELLEHLVDPYNFLRESVRVLRNGGHLIVSIPNVFHPKELYWNLFKIEDNSGHIYNWTWQTFSGLVDRADLKIVRHSCQWFRRSTVYVCRV